MPSSPAMPQSHLPSVSVVIPVFNGSKTLSEVVERSGEALRGCTSRYEFILINDGSADRSWEVIENIAERMPNVIGIDLARNYGQHNALLAGIREANCDITVTIDDDLQNPPEEMPKLLQALTDDCDVVYGEPRIKRQGVGRRVATQITVRTLGLLGGRTAPMVSAFRAFRTNLRDSFTNYSGPDVSIDGLLTWGTEQFRSVPVRHEPRVHGDSNYSLVSLVRHALTMVTAFSTRPLRIATTLGFFVILFGVAVLTYVLLRFLLEGDSVPGFPFLASIISIFSGAQLFAVGVIGEYLARMHVRVMARPSYAVKAIVQGREAVDAYGSSQPDETEDGALCRVLEWDSAFWGFSVARVIPQKLDRKQAKQVERWCSEAGVRCTYLLAQADDAQTAVAAESVGFRPVDVRVTCLHRGHSAAPRAVKGGWDGIVREAVAEDAAAIAAIAHGAHTDTRFFFDSHFPTERARELYMTWIRQGVTGDDGPLLVAELHGVLSGYLLLADNPYRIDLIAVAEKARKTGVGSALVAEAIARTSDGTTQVVTQARNVGALRLYQANGFYIAATEVWYHRWS